MMIDYQISVGEALDRLSILSIKTARIRDKEKSDMAFKEMMALSVVLETAGVAPLPREYNELCQVNGELWDVEDEIRKSLRTHLVEKFRPHEIIELAGEFCGLAARVPVLNDKRAELKNKIDADYGSEIHEVKSYV